MEVDQIAVGDLRAGSVEAGADFEEPEPEEGERDGVGTEASTVLLLLLLLLPEESPMRPTKNEAVPSTLKKSAHPPPMVTMEMIDLRRRPSSEPVCASMVFASVT